MIFASFSWVKNVYGSNTTVLGFWEGTRQQKGLFLLLFCPRSQGNYSHYHCYQNCLRLDIYLFLFATKAGMGGNLGNLVSHTYSIIQKLGYAASSISSLF
jgi:hypothetical protein